MDVVYKPLTDSQGTNAPVSKQVYTWDRLCLIYGTRVTKGESLGGVTEVEMYQVPTGKIFLLLTAELSCTNLDAVLANSANMWVESKSGGTINNGALIRLRADLTTAASNRSIGTSAAISPAVPIRLLAGDKVLIDGLSTGGRTHGAITGYEIDQAIFYDLL